MAHTYRAFDCIECDGRMRLESTRERTLTSVTPRGSTGYRKNYKYGKTTYYWMCENSFTHNATYIAYGEMGQCERHGGTDERIGFECADCATIELELQHESRLGL
jgi:hypothetical protein